MTKILFWNVNKKNLWDLLCNAVKLHAVDVVAVLEDKTPPEKALLQLRESVSPTFVLPRCINLKFRVFVRHPRLDMQEVFGDGRLSIRRLQTDSGRLLLALVHGLDKRNHDEKNQRFEFNDLLDKVATLERDHKHSRTVFLGDFNVNPFEGLMTDPDCFSAVMSRLEATQKARTFQGKKYRLLYNPMWGLLGDLSTGPPGTFFNSSQRGLYGWNMLDQVVLKPDAIAYWKSVQILDSIDGVKLATDRGRPRKEKYSDHFPLLVTMK